ncbi:MAG: glycosyltransferase family 4 protein [Chitinophagaceae bacterium]|nr:glycosyltransferase family 4 protein [Chitinophagaceae bacterium]
MRIAVNTRFLVPAQLEGYGYFTREVFFLLANNHPEHHFIFFFDRPFDTSVEFSKNVTPVVLPPKARHALSFRWWFDVKIPLALKKYKADVFVSPDGFCSLITRVPQVLVVHDLAFIHHPKFISTLHRIFYQRYTPLFLKKAAVIATVSEFSKSDIMEQYHVDEGKIINVSSAAKSIFQPVTWEEKEVIKATYADGCEYFIFVGGIHPRKNLLNLLKAFSLFKKRQRSNMKLLIAGRLAWDYEQVVEKMETYKYRQDVKLLGYLEEAALAKLVAGSYALVFPSYFEGFGVPILEAMQCNVPVITSGTSSMPEIGEEAALYADPTDPADIADQMKRIFTNENLRSQLIEKGKVVAPKYSWLRTSERIWQAIQQAVSK